MPPCFYILNTKQMQATDMCAEIGLAIGQFPSWIRPDKEKRDNPIQSSFHEAGGESDRSPHSLFLRRGWPDQAGVVTL